MIRLVILGVLALSLQAAPPSITVYEVDGSTQTNRITKIGYVFRDGDITANQFPQPKINGVAATVWQADVKSRYASGSPKIVLLAYQETLSASGNNVITFQANVSASSAGSGLTQAQMIAFNGGNWGAQQEITGMGTGTTVLRNAATMLGNTDPATFPECGNNYWRKGPVVTEVIVQDCTSATLYDFGWAWNGSTMGAFCGTAAVGGGSGNGNTCSIHPSFILTFYPTLNVVEVSFIQEIARLNRIQDQMYDLVLKTGNPLTQVYAQTGAKKITSDANITGSGINGRGTVTTTTSSPFSASDVGSSLFFSGLSTTITGFNNSKSIAIARTSAGTVTNGTAYENLHYRSTRRRKVFWSGTAQGNIRIDYNFAYLVAAKAIPPFDLTVSVSPDSGHDDNYINVVGGSDVGDGMGDGLFRLEWQGGQGYSGNPEGAPLERNDVQLLYSMGANCGVANSNCAKAYYINTGIRGAIDTTLATSISGGAGLWERQAHVPYHWRENRTTATGVITSGNSYYCPNLADVNAKNDGTNPVTGNGCGSGVGTATGRPLSRYAHSADETVDNIFPTTASGTQSLGGWTTDVAHWQDWAYLPYLLTGDYYYYEELMFSGSVVLSMANPGNGDVSTSAGPFGFITGTSVRSSAWGNLQLAHSLYAVTDKDFDGVTTNPTFLYFKGMSDSNALIEEGFMNLTGTPLSPVTINSACSAFNINSVNRWGYGRCGHASNCRLTNGTNCPTPITQALHAINPGECATLYGNGTVGSHIFIITASADLGGGVTSFTTGQPPINGEVVTFMGGFGPWVAINGQTLVTTLIDSTHFSVNFDSSALGALSGALRWVSHGIGTVTAATSANPSVVSTSTVTGTQLAGMWGATGAWVPLNIYGTKTFVNSTSLSVPANLIGIGQPPTGTIWWSNFAVDLSKNSSITPGWQEHGYEIMTGVNLDLGLTNWTSVATEALLRISEQLNSANINPYLVGQYSSPLKANGANQCNTFVGQVNNPYHSTWAAVLDAFIPAAQAIATFNADGTLTTAQCDDHSYGLTGLAAIAYAQTYGITGGAAGYTWMNVHFPFFNNNPVGSNGCGSSDIQAKFAFAPRVAVCSITTNFLTNALFGVAYSQTLANANCGASTWTISAGSLPAWASLNAGTGAITGTPSGATPTTSNFTVAFDTATQPLSILTITPPTITTTSPLLSATTGIPYIPLQFTATGDTGGNCTGCVWSATGIPTGMTFSSGGVLAGTPTGSGAFTLNVSVTNNSGAGVTGPQGFLLSVNLPPGGPGGTITVGGTVTLGNTVVK